MNQAELYVLQQNAIQAKLDRQKQLDRLYKQDQPIEPIVGITPVPISTKDLVLSTTANGLSGLSNTSSPIGVTQYGLGRIPTTKYLKK